MISKRFLLQKIIYQKIICTFAVTNNNTKLFILKMKKILGLVLVVGIAILMTLTRPDKKAHKEAMMKAVKEYVDEKAEESGFGDNGITRFGKGIVNKTIEAALGTVLKIDDYYLFNTSHVKTSKGNKILSVGLFGQVITFNKDMIRDALEQAKEDKIERKLEKKEEKRLRKEARKAEREAKKAARKAEKEARKAARKAEREAKKAEKELKN